MSVLQPRFASLRYFHRYSIDVAVSSLALLVILKKNLAVPISITYEGLLFFSVLMIYNLDHYLDGINDPETKNDYLITACIAFLISLLLLGKQLFELDFALLVYGMPLLIGIIFYLFLIYFYERNLFYLKELVVSLFFTLGILCPVFINMIKVNQVFPSHLFHVFLILFTVILHNAFIESYLKQGKDSSKNISSIWIQLAKKNNSGLTMVNLLGFFNLLLILSWKNHLNFNLAIYFLIITILQQIILNAGKRENPTLQCFFLNSVFMIGFFL